MNPQKLIFKHVRRAAMFDRSVYSLLRGGKSGLCAGSLMLPWKVMIEKLSGPALGHRIAQHHFAVVDGLLGTTTSAAMRREIQQLQQNGILHLNSTHLVRSGITKLLPKQGIWEAELADSAIQAAAPLCSQLQRDATLRTMLGMHLPTLRLQTQAAKLQYNEGNGACFPIHVDNEESIDGRRLTAILYLNPHWSEADGGQLRVYPPFASPTDIAPLNDRLVIFESHRLLHRVLPSRSPRFCLTVWMSELQRPKPSLSPALVRAKAALKQCALDGRQLSSDNAAILVRDPQVSRHIGRLLHCEEWAESIQESHFINEQVRSELVIFWEENRILSRLYAPLMSVVHSF